MDVTPRQLIFWEFSTHNSVISATTFIKNGLNFPPPLLFQAPRLLKSRNHILATPCLANINKLRNPPICQPKKARAADKGRKSKASEVR